jgi:HD-like signal output (HDOD) protein
VIDVGLFGAKKKGRDNLLQRKLEAVLSEGEVPTFPAVVLKILKKLRDPEASIEEVAKAIQWDPGLMVKVLATVNSAAYGPATPISSVEHAASFMGRSALEQLVLALAVKDTLPKAPARGFEPARYWRTASFRAGLAKHLAERIHPARAAECFTMGLLQDLAIPVLATSRPDDYGAVLDAWHGDREADLDALERSEFGWTHADVGGMLGHHWELPAPLVDSITRHHNPQCDDRLIAPAIRLVSVLRETETDRAVEALVETANQDYGVEKDWTLEAVQMAQQQAEDLAHMLK